MQSRFRFSLSFPRGGAVLRPALLVAAATAACLFAVVATAGAATRVGETFDPAAITAGSGLTTLQSGSPGGQYTVPFGGVITSWSFQASANPAGVPQLKFKVARPAGGTNFTVVGEDIARTPAAGMLNTYPTQIAVKAGDVIGYYRITQGFIYASVANGYSIQSAGGDVAPGTMADFGGPLDGFKLDLSASLEPDIDCDGKGDETQDANLLDGPCSPKPAKDSIPPESKITKAKVDHESAMAKVRFSGSDNAAGALSFKCRLDKRKFKNCKSPKTYRNLKPGRHRIRVQAIDAAGNIDPTPAKKKFTV